MNGKRSNKQPPKRRAPLTDRQVELLLSRLLRDAELLRQVHRQLDASDFLPRHRGYALVMSVLEDYFAQFRAVPNREELLGELEHRLLEDPDGLSEEEQEALGEFVEFAYETKLLRREAALRLFRHYGEDCLAALARRDLGDERVVPNVLELTANYQRRSAMLAAADEGVELPFDEDGDDEDAMVRKVPTGVDFLDEMYNGGEGAGEVTLFLSPHGTCKTLLACQLSYNRSQLARAAWYENNCKGPLGYTYLFYWEDPRELMQVRIGCYSAHIDRNNLENGVKHLNGPGQYHEYEHERFRHLFEAGRKVPCERQRFEAAKKRLQLNWRMVDMRGVREKNRNRGGGWYREVAAIIEADQHKQRSLGYEPYVAGVYIDYLGAMCLRHLYENGLPRDQLWGLLKDSALNIKHDIAGQFDTTVWVNHQFDAKANGLPPGVLPDRTMAADCKVVGENFDFVFCCGTKTAEDSYALFGMSKGRRAPGHNSLVIHIDGKFGRVVSTEGKMVVDSHSRRIVSAAELRGFAETATQTGSPPEPQGRLPDPLPSPRVHKAKARRGRS